MKKTGLVLIIIGILLTIFTTFGFFTRKKVVDIGRLEITTNEPHRVNWSPYLGVATIVLGGALFLFGLKKKG